MKKVLFATTALIASAGVAAAQGVTVTGAAEMGINGGDGQDTEFFQDIDVRFTMSGETDNGLTFGAAVDLDEAQDDCDTTVAQTCVNDALDDTSEDGGVAIFISGDFGTLTMGDTDGALDFAMQEANTAADAGSIADDHTSHDGYLGSYSDGAYDGQIVRYDHSIGDFGFAVSVEMDETGARDVGYAVGATYNFSFGGGNVVFGAGYQTADQLAGTLRTGTAFGAGDTDEWGVSAALALDNGFEATIAYSTFEVAGGISQDHIGVGVGYSFDAITVHANYGVFDDSTGADIDGFGFAAAYDLGGGASVHFGYGADDADTYSFGVNMSF